jgi:2-succinyl-5-enolpyruvyl-6-hydroxy-3-cyclohexene-1-carboxylate synthase
MTTSRTPAETPNLSTLWGRVLVDELARCGLRHAVVAPGSRSTPLAFALADHPDVLDLSVIDERSAGFVALGLARATGRPVAVVSTSGTAAANFLPAVTEADRAAVPLLVLTADRPADLLDAGDSQAADQVKLYGSRVRWFHQVAEPSAEERRLAYLRSTAGHAWSSAGGAAGGPPGPVHLNLPLAKPLEPTPVTEGPGALPPGFDPTRSPGASGRPGGAPWRRVSAGTAAPSGEDLDELARALAGARRPLILIGAPTGALAGADLEALAAALARLAEALPVPVWAEAASGLRTAPAPCPGLVATADLLLGSARFRDFARPDLVLRLGEAPLAWPLRRWASDLAEAGTRQVAIDPWGRRRDPEHAVGRMVAADPAATLEAVAARLVARAAPAAAEPGWLATHLAADRAARDGLERELDRLTSSGEIFEGGVFWHLGRLLPEDAALVVSSSMPLRDLEAFLPASRRPVDLFSNRGLNGIDGVTSTAAGIALARRVARPAAEEGADPAFDARTVLVTGDVAFSHDLSGALAAGRLGADLTVVLLDNGGGAIFDYLPAAGFEPGFSRHMTTPPGIGFAEVAGGCGLAYEAVESWKAFAEALERSLDAPGPRLLHLRIDRERGHEMRRRVLEAMAAAVDALPFPQIPDPPVEPRDPRLAPRSVSWSPPAPARAASPAEGPPLVLLHGFTGSAHGWADLARRLRTGGGTRDGAGGGPAVAALELPGHGGGGPQAESWEAAVDSLADAVGELLRERGAAGVHLVGYSMGARLALAVALRAPDRLASLAVVSGSPGIADSEERAARRAADEALAREIEAGGLAAFVDRWMSRPFFATQHTGPSRLGHRRLRHARAERLAGGAHSYAAALRTLGQGAQPSYLRHLGELAVPTLLVAGALDGKYVELAREMAREMAERMPAARVEIVPGAGHAVHLEAPDAVARLLLRHARASSGSGPTAG